MRGRGTGRGNLGTRGASEPGVQVEDNHTTNTTTTTGPYDQNFEILLYNGGVYIDDAVLPNIEPADLPKNSDDIGEMIYSPRRDMQGWTKDLWTEFKVKDKAAVTEKERMKLMKHIDGYKLDDAVAGQNHPFSQFASIVPAVPISGQPDQYYGARSTRINPDISDTLAIYIVPMFVPGCPILTNYFLEVKGPQGRERVARRQAVHCGVLGARAMLILQSWTAYGTTTITGRPIEDDRCYTITSTYESAH